MVPYLILKYIIADFVVFMRICVWCYCCASFQHNYIYLFRALSVDIGCTGSQRSPESVKYWC